MDNTAKLAMLKTILNITDTSQDAVLAVYLDSSARALLAWKYEYVPADKRPVEVPADEEQNQIWACVAGYGIRGAEGQLRSVENGITREWKYADMLQCIKSNIVPIAGVL